MTFQQLQYLLAINRTGSVSQAAKELFITQSSVSIALASLEAELNCRIFIRSTQGLTLTPEGRQVIGHAQRICESHQLLTSSVKPAKQQLRIASIDYTPARNAFVRLLDKNLKRQDISFGFHRIAGFENRLVRGDIDLAINLSFSQYDEIQIKNAQKLKLHYEKLTSIPATICIGRGHRLYEKEDPKPEDFAEDWLLEAVGKPICRAGVLLAYLPINPERALECSNIHLSQQLRHSGYVYAITHLRDKQERLADGFRYIPIPGLRYSVFVYWDSVRAPSAEAVRYLELLKEEIAHTEY